MLLRATEESSRFLSQCPSSNTSFLVQDQRQRSDLHHSVPETHTKTPSNEKSHRYNSANCYATPFSDNREALIASLARRCAPFDSVPAYPVIGVTVRPFDSSKLFVGASTRAELIMDSTFRL